MLSSKLIINFVKVRAIIGAALDLVGEGIQVAPRILVPMICTVHEFHAVLEIINRTAFQVIISTNCYYFVRVI